MKKLRYVLILITLLLSGCGDFQEPLGDDYFWLRTNASNHMVFHDRDLDGSFSGFEDYKDPRNEIIIDSNAIKVNIVGSHILAYRVETDFYDGLGNPPPHYGYHIADKATGNIRRSVSFEEVVSFLNRNNYKFPYDMCRQEGSIYKCLGLAISSSWNWGGI